MDCIQCVCVCVCGVYVGPLSDAAMFAVSSPSLQCANRGSWRSGGNITLMKSPTIHVYMLQLDQTELNDTWRDT